MIKMYNLFYFTILICILVCTIIFVVKNCNKTQVTPPVEKIDSLNKANDALKLKINKLENDKDSAIESVKTFSNDSTLELFYKLIRKE